MNEAQLDQNLMEKDTHKALYDQVVIDARGFEQNRLKLYDQIDVLSDELAKAKMIHVII
jgi:hypothetical protein